ncbi:MAG TPA: VOC family protein [Granulicella sp.]
MPQSLPKPGVFRHNSSSTTLGRFELALKVADVNVSLAFYRKLGFQWAGGDTKDGIVVVQNGACRIALFQGYLAENLLNFVGGDVSTIAGQLQAAGVEFTKPPFTDATGKTTALLRDPDGNAIYLGFYPDKD